MTLPFVVLRMPLLLACLLALTITVLTQAAFAEAAAGPQKISCKRQASAVKGTKGKKRKKAQAALARCQKQNRDNRTVFNKLKDSRLVGQRGDGAGVDWTFCADGRYTSAVTSYGSTGTSTGTKWQVTEATVKKDGSFAALVEDRKEGWSVAVGLNGPQWLAAVSRDPYEWGNVTRSDAGAACA